MGNMLGCIIFVVGLVPGIIAWYWADQQDWVAMLVMGGIMVLIDGGIMRWQRSSMAGLRRFWHANAGGHMLFVPNWMWGAAQIGNAIYVNVI